MAITSIEGERLVGSHCAGDPDAFPAIVKAHYPALLARARHRLHDPQAAEDAVQEALLRAYRSLPRFGAFGEFHLTAWLYRILENVCIDEANRRRRTLAVVERLAAEPETLAPDPQTAAELPNPQVTTAIEGLPAPYRDALVQREIEGRTYADIAAAAGISEDNARARVSRARSALRRLIAPVLTAVAWLAGTTRRGERALLLDGTTHAATSSPVTAAVAPVSVHIPAATQLLTQVTTVVPESSMITAVKVATAAVIAVALPVGGVTAVSRPESSQGANAPAVQVVQSPEPDSSAGGQASAPGTTASGDSVRGVGDGATDELAAAIDSGAAEGDTATADTTDIAAGDGSEPAGEPTSEGTSVADPYPDTTAEAEEPAPAPTEPEAEPAAPPVRASSAVVLDTASVYRNTLDDGRYELDGPVAFTTPAGEFGGQLTITCAAPAAGGAAEDEYRFAGSIVTTGNDTGRIRLAGSLESWSVDEDGVRTLVYKGRYTVVDDAGYELPLKGSFTASFRDTGRSELLVRLVPNGASDTTS